VSSGHNTLARWTAVRRVYAPQAVFWLLSSASAIWFHDQGVGLCLTPCLL